ncbi:hypothetical protein FHU13_003065 [Methylobacterium sp. R2-1]|nr:hypothetical protein [Methylobacterium sp. R2-1]
MSAPGTGQRTRDEARDRLAGALSPDNPAAAVGMIRQAASTVGDARLTAGTASMR